MMLALSVLLGACASTRSHGTSGRYAFDTATNSCRQHPANCAALPGQPVAPHPVAAAAMTASATLRVLDAATRALVEKALKECADEARSVVLLRHKQDFKGASPTEEECRNQVVDVQGRRVTRAMQLGTEMHEVALSCAEEQLSKLRPGGFSREPRYRYDGGRTTWLSPAEEASLRAQRRYSELEGSLSPDIVLHWGDPLQVQAVYDFKFPCVNIDKVPPWGEYPEGHPHQDFNQGQLYQRALGPVPARVVPRLGVIP
jgi:hypothetical protein